MSRRGCDPLQALTPHSNPLGAQGEGRSSSAPGRAVLSLEGGLGHRDVAGVPGMGPGRAAQGLAALWGPCSACLCSVWLCTELTSPGLCHIVHYVIIIKM